MRKPVQLSLSEEFIAALDEACGDVPRSRFVESAMLASGKVMTPPTIPTEALEEASHAIVREQAQQAAGATEIVVEAGTALPVNRYEQKPAPTHVGVPGHPASCKCNSCLFVRDNARRREVEAL